MRRHPYRQYISDDSDEWAPEDHPRSALIANLHGQAMPAAVFQSGLTLHRSVPASLDEPMSSADAPEVPPRLVELRMRLQAELEAAPKMTPTLIRTAFLFVQSAEKSVRELADDEGVSAPAMECRRHAIERHYPNFKKAWKERKFHVRRRSNK